MNKLLATVTIIAGLLAAGSTAQAGMKADQAERMRLGRAACHERINVKYAKEFVRNDARTDAFKEAGRQYYMQQYRYQKSLCDQYWQWH